MDYENAIREAFEEMKLKYLENVEAKRRRFSYVRNGK